MGHSRKNVISMLQSTISLTPDIIACVEDLEGDFTHSIEDVEAEETRRIGEHNLLMQKLHDEANVANADLKEAEELKAEKMEKIAQDNTELTETNAQLMDDQSYIKDLTDKCNLKSREWD